MIKFHVINDTNPQEFSKKIEEFCYNKVIINIKYSTNNIQIIKKVILSEEEQDDNKPSRIETVKTNYSALIQYQ